MSNSSELERQIRIAFDAGRFDLAATLIIEQYGAELQTFLRARLRSETDGDEAFSMFVEALWGSLPSFRWQASARGWAYALARHAGNRLRSAPAQRRQNNLTLSELEHISVLAVHPRSATQQHLRTESKDRVRALRERLEPDDQMLLLLRVDKGMPFRELALVMNDGQVEAERVDDEAARLRKRFERIKRQLREWARADGLLGEGPAGADGSAASTS